MLNRKLKKRLGWQKGRRKSRFMSQMCHGGTAISRYLRGQWNGLAIAGGQSWGLTGSLFQVWLGPASWSRCGSMTRSSGRRQLIKKMCHG